ncbi:MAG: MFS transporter [Candidatus Methylacidiphilales bacterium]|nr:MFS transporter [Candidatus Methylacidiphilales bacterium]
MVPPPATSETAAKKSSFREMLENHNFVLLWWGQLISSIGDRFTSAALLFFVFKGEEVGKYTAQFSFAGMLPGLLFAPLYGWIIDSFDRKTIMIVADIIRIYVVLTFVYVLSDQNPDYMLACLALFILGTFNGLFIPARQSALPQIVEPDRLLTANSLIALLGPVGTLLGTPLAILIIKIVDPCNAYLINALTFGASAVCIMRITRELWPDKKESASTEHEPLKKSWSELADGWKTLLSHRPLIPLVLIHGLFAFSSLMFIVVVMEHAKKNIDIAPIKTFLEPLVAWLHIPILDHSEYQMIAVATLFICVFLGMGLGIYFAGQAKRAVHWNALPHVGLIGLGLGFFVFANLTHLAIVLPFGLLLGALATAIPVPIEARIQNDVANHHRGRLFALRNMWTTLCGLTALGLNIDGRLLKLYGAPTMITWLGAAMVTAALLLLLRDLSVLRTFWTARQQ